MTMSHVLERADVLTTMPLGVGANPIEQWFVDECGDCDLWADLDGLFDIRLESL